LKKEEEKVEKIKKAENLKLKKDEEKLKKDEEKVEKNKKADLIVSKKNKTTEDNTYNSSDITKNQELALMNEVNITESAKEEEEEEEEEQVDRVKKFIFKGETYLKSLESGIIYNLEQDVIGKWNEERQMIEIIEEDEEVEEEYEYE